MSNVDDILGGTLRTKPPSSVSVLVKYPLYLSFALALWLACVWSWNWLKARQEMNYRLSMRRKHGIPDDDRRPFNVAYAAVMRTRQQREQEEQKSAEADRLRAEIDRERAELEAVAEEEARIIARDSRRLQEMGSSFESSFKKTTNSESQDVYYKAPIYIPTPDPPVQLQHEGQVQRQRKRKNLRFSESTTLEDHYRNPKRAYEDEGEDYGAKKTRVEGDELIDGDETSRFGRRSAKRVLGDEEVEGVGQRRKKRDRKQSVVIDLDQDEEMDDGEILQSPKARGKKRERRVEDEEDPASGDEKSRKGRKRRTMQKRKSDLASEEKGKRKREDTEVDRDEGPSKRASRKKGSKKATVEDEKEEGSDVSMDSPISKDPLCRGRRVGEKWEVNGVKYKVGVNGERLRQTLVKRARSKFVMPQDSQHPDRQANLEVFIETWLTEDAYRQAKDRQELAWQISPVGSADPSPTPSPLSQTTPNIPQPETPTKNAQGGKNLLWSSTASSTRSGSPHYAPRLSLPPYLSSRRVSSAFVPINHLAMSGATGKQGAYRSFSKWEKQDLEAEAMRKMRAKLQEQKKAEAAKNAPPPSAPQLSSSVSAPPASGFSIPKPDEKPAIIVTPPTATEHSFSLPQPATKPAPTPTPAASTVNSFSFPKPAEGKPAATALSSAFGPSSTSPSDNHKPTSLAPPTSNPVKPAESTSGFSAPSSFSFPKQPQPQQSTQTDRGATNFFGPQTGSTLSTTGSQNSKPSFNLFPVNTQSTTSGASNVPAPSPFTAPSSNPTPWTASKPQIQSQTSPPDSIFGDGKKKLEQAPSTGGGLSSRMSGFSAPPTQAAGSSQGPSTANTSSSGTPFPFAKPTAQSSTAQATPASTPAPPKFNFGFTSKPASTSTAPAPTTGLNPGATTTQKPTSSPFGFPANESSASGDGAGSSTTTPKFSFGGFGNTTTSGESASSQLAPKPFSGFGPGSTTPAGSPAPGNGDKGKSGSVFGGNNVTAGSQETKPTFSFNATTPSTVNTQSNPGGFTFQFGTQGTSTPSPFGASVKNNTSSSTAPSAFGQSSNSTPNPFGFGASSTSGGQNQQQK